MDPKPYVAANKDALTSIIAGFVALLAVFEGQLRLPRAIYQNIIGGLFKAEAATRRLIFVAACGVVAPLQTPQMFPAGHVIKRAGTVASRRSFPLFDPRVNYSFEEPDTSQQGPRIRVVGEADPRSLFLAKFKRFDEGLCSETESQNLRLRLAAITRAINNIPREALRMAKWQARRKAMANPKFTSPIRPGQPPGYCKRSRAEIDELLERCHYLAWEAERNDSS